MFYEELKFESTTVARSYVENFETAHEVVCELTTTEYGINKATIREESSLVNPTIEISQIWWRTINWWWMVAEDAT